MVDGVSRYTTACERGNELCLKALMSLFVLASRDGWVNIMYTGLDAVGVDQQVSANMEYFNTVFKYIIVRVSG